MTGLEVIYKNFPFLMQGLFVTLKLAFVSMLLSVFFGTILGVIRYAKIPIIRHFVGLFVDITRSIPLILYIIFIHFSISPYMYEHATFMRHVGVNCLEMYSAIIAIVAFTSAYVAEIIRSGLESVEKEQILAAKALGLNDFQIIQFVVLPQAVSRMKPALCAQFITMIKDTSLASAIGLVEFTRASEIVYENSSNEFQILLFVALVYLSVNFMIERFFIPNERLSSSSY